MGPFENSAWDRHEAVHMFRDERAGLKAIIALHSTVLGPAAGGCRDWQYASSEDALTDALRLSRGMSFKNALAGLPLGGGKAVLMRDGAEAPRAEKFAAFGRAVDSLGGRYVTAEDVGTRVVDMQEVARVTAFVSGLSGTARRAGGDPAPKTALGTFLAIREAWAYVANGATLTGVRIAVQGIGGVGYSLCKLLHEAGASLVVADTDAQRTTRAQLEFGADIVGVHEILSVPVDVLAPCAMGGVFDAHTIPALQARLICGAANNQLATAEDGARLRDRGILYAPDYVVNAGGIISVAFEYLRSGSERDVLARIERIPLTLRRVFDEAADTTSPTSDVADRLAQSRIDAAARKLQSSRSSARGAA